MTNLLLRLYEPALLRIQALAFLLFFIAPCTFSQGVVISSQGTDVPHPSALLEVRGVNGASVQGGIMTPSLTEAQRTALTATAVEGLWVYQNNNLRGYYLFDGASWIRVGSNTAVSGKVMVNSATQSITGSVQNPASSYSVVQSSPGVFNVVLASAYHFDSPPSVILTAETYPGLASGTTPPDYCQPVHVNNCVPTFAADYLDDFRLISRPGGTYSAGDSFDDLNTGCDNTPDNYVDKSATHFGTIYGTVTAGGSGGAAGSDYTILMSSGPEWLDNLFAFIDWNQDADFFDGDEVVFEHYFTGTGPNNPAYAVPQNSGPLTVPATATNGQTVLRGMSLFSENIPFPCDDNGSSFSWGETQDYGLTVYGGDPLSVPPPRASLCTLGNVTTAGFQVFCSDLGENRIGTSFNFYATEN